MEINPYPSDVCALSDEELKILSAELQEAYEVNGEDDWDYWTDDAAENRYHEMLQEIYRRFMLANPDWRPPTPNEFSLTVLATLKDSLCFARRVNEAFERECPGKIGDAIEVRRPTRLVEG